MNLMLYVYFIVLAGENPLDFNNFFIQFGAIGFAMIGLVWFSKFLFTEQMKQKNDLEKHHATLQTEFREYLKETVKEQYEVIQANTDAYNRFVSMIEVYISRNKDVK